MLRMLSVSPCRAALCIAVILLLCITAACAAAPAAPEVVDVLPSHTPAPVATQTPAPTCNVPDLRFETEAYARKALAGQGINNINVEYVATSDIPAGLVAEQSIPSGECPQDGTPLKLLVSVPAPTPTAEPTAESTAAPTPPPATKKPERTNAPAKADKTQAPATQAPIPSIPPEVVSISASQQPQVTPQPTWSLDMSMFDQDDSCG